MKLTPYRVTCQLRSSGVQEFRKKSLGDFRENPDIDNLSPWEKVSKKTRKVSEHRGLYFLRGELPAPPFLTTGDRVQGV
jgi:hypothetical protein